MTDIARITTPDGTSGLAVEPWARGEVYAIAANWAQAASPVLSYSIDGEWESTGHQVADYRHDPYAALRAHLADETGEDDETLDDAMDDTIEIEEEKTCTCGGCGCTEPATTTDDGGAPCCEPCADYYVADEGEVVCARMQTADTPCRHCGGDIEWGRIQTRQWEANWREGECECRRWKQEDRGGRWILSEGDPLVDTVTGE